MAKKVTLYGIPNCDTVKKARTWLDAQGVTYEFHDFNKQGLDRALAQGWLKSLGPEVLINRKGTTWRKLDPAHQAQADSAAGALALMLEQPSMIKRPVLDRDGALSVGFTPDTYAKYF
ncbi:MAG: arsenate reductase [Bradyrhizobium sp.]|nr:arsenate reductase [Bradyrhizobium sp.]